MDTKVPKSHPPSLKAKVAAEVIKEHKTAARSRRCSPTQVEGWKKQTLAGLPDILGNGREQMRQQSEAEKDELYKQIGQLKVECPGTSLLGYNLQRLHEGEDP